MYSPHPSELQEGAKFLQRCLSEASTAETQLDDKHAPVLAHFLSYRGQSHGEAIQVLAGKLLLTQARKGLHGLPSRPLSFVKMAGLNGTCAPSIEMRKGAATVVVTLACTRPPRDWPELFPTLLRMLESPSVPEVEGALATLQSFSEKAPERFLADAPFEKLAPIIITFLSDSDALHHEIVLGCLATNLSTKWSTRDDERSYSLATNANALIAGIAAIFGGISVESRKDACRLVLVLMNHQKVDMGMCVNMLLDTMALAVDSDKDGGDLMAQLRCEFWIKVFTGTRSYAGDVALHGRIRVLLPSLCHVLIDRLTLPQTSVDESHAAFHDCAVPDPLEDVASAANERGAGQDKQSLGREADGSEVDAASQDLRRSAAAALDALASANGSFTVLPIILPLVQERLMHSNVWVREAGILALGAIAECQHQSDMDTHMIHIFPYLLKQLVDPTPQVRRITLWTISRYSAWTFGAHSGLDGSGCQELIEGLLMRVLDRHKLVQEAACSALASVLGYALEKLVPFLSYILRNLMHAFGQYQAKNFLILCDTIGTLADAVGPSLTQHAEVVLPPLLAKWRDLCLSGREEVAYQLPPLLECLTSVIQAVGQGVRPHAADIFRGAVDFLDLTLGAEDQTESLGSTPAVVVCALDLLTALSEVTGGEFWILVCQVSSEKSSKTAIELSDACAKHEAPQVRQSACALLGVISKGCGQHLVPLLDSFLPVLIQNLEAKPAPVCNNASWAIGELVLRVGPSSMQPYVGAIMTHLIPLVVDERSGTTTLAENATITIGRIGCVCPGLAAPMLGQFCQQWCTRMTRLQDRFERENTSRALCLMAIANPMALSENFTSFCDTATLWNQTHSQLPPDVWKMFHDILHSSLHNYREQLASYIQSANSLSSEYLFKTYNLGQLTGLSIPPERAMAVPS